MESGLTYDASVSTVGDTSAAAAVGGIDPALWEPQELGENSAGIGNPLRGMLTDVTNTSCSSHRVVANLENLEYSGISLNVENSGYSHGNLFKLREKL